MNRWGASLLVLLGGASYGLISPVVKMAYAEGFSAGSVTSSQYAAALLILLVIALFKIGDVRKLARRDLLLLTGLGVLSTGTSVLYYVSLSYLPASLAIVLLFQFTWIVMMIDYLVTRSKPSPMKWLALMLVLAGTVLAVNLFATDWRGVQPVGLLLGFLSSITYGAFLFFTGYVRPGVSPWVNSGVIAAASTISVFFVFPPTFAWDGSLGEGLWIWALIIGLLGQVIPPVCFNVGIPVVGGSLAAVLGAIELPVAVLGAFLLIGEAVESVQWIGIVLIVLGIVVAELRLGLKRREALS